MPFVHVGLDVGHILANEPNNSLQTKIKTFKRYQMKLYQPLIGHVVTSELHPILELSV